VELDGMEKNLIRAFDRFLKKQEEKLVHLEALIKQMDPIGILNRGYTRTESQGKPIHLLNLSEGDQLITHTATQKLSSTLTKIEKK
jgi:exodeoxyribonuclease VII large subunit